MKKQKICIIGGGLTGFVTAITLANLNIEVDLVVNNIKNIKSKRTTAISQSNFDFIKKLKIKKSLDNFFWPCQNMKIYSFSEEKKLKEILELNKKENRKNILYMVNNSSFLKIMIENVKKRKLIKIKNEKINKIYNSDFLKSIEFKNGKICKYNLIIACTGSDSDLIKNLFQEKSFEHLYNEVAVTGILKHNLLKNNIARQIFFKGEILALLPIAKQQTSFVWSIKKKINW